MSMDEIDVANDHIERELANSLAAVRAAKPAPVYLNCLNCEEPVTAGRAYCSAECAEDGEHRARQNKRAGVR